MHNCRVCAKRLVGILVIASSTFGQLIDLDETGEWLLTGGGRVDRVSATEAPNGAQGNYAVRCTVGPESEKQVYLRCDLGERDITPFGKLCFRIHGEPGPRAIGVVTLIDGAWQHRQWPSTAMREISRTPRWTDVTVALRFPIRDRGADLHSVKWLTWFVVKLGTSADTQTFYLDSVRFLPSPADLADGPETVLLPFEGMKAVFRKSAQYDLTELRLPDGGKLHVTATASTAPLDTGEALPQHLRLGREPAIRNIEQGDSQLSVTVDLGDFSCVKTYSWEGGALRVDAVFQAGKSGRAVAAYFPAIVRFGDAFTGLTYDHGEISSDAVMPYPGVLGVPGNWLAATCKAGTVATIFPRLALRSARFERNELLFRDRLMAAGCPVRTGESIRSTVWLAPLPAGSAAHAIQTAATRLGEVLEAQADPLAAYFAPRFLRPEWSGTASLAGTDRFTVWQASASVAIPCHAKPPSGTSSGITVYAARGEVEPIHVAVYAHTDLAKITATCGPLRAPSGSIPAGAIRVRYPRYILLRRATEAEKRVMPVPEQAECIGDIYDADTELLTTRFYGRSTRVLGPVEDVLCEQPALQVGNAENCPLWLTIRVPPDAQPGTYTGVLRISEAGRRSVQIPIELTVWAFALPKVTSLRTWYQLWPTPVVRPYLHAYYRDLAEHKVSGFGSMPAHPKISWREGKLNVDWAEYDAAARMLFDELGMRNAKLPYGKRGGGHVNVYDFAGLKLGTTEFEQAYSTFLAQAGRHLAARGWLEGLDCYIFDEPDRERIAAIAAAAPIIRRELPSMRVFAACARNTSSLVGILNAWCPPVAFFGAGLGDFSASRVREGRARGDVYWWYNQEDNAIGCPVVTHRALLWGTWAADIEGYFVWCINHWGNKGMPWSTVFDIGEAMVIYPGKDGPIDSLRWEQTREGLEDYDYLKLLERAAETAAKAPLRAECSALLTEARALLPDPRCQLGCDPRKLEKLRLRIGRVLNRTH